MKRSLRTVTLWMALFGVVTGAAALFVHSSVQAWLNRPLPAQGQLFEVLPGDSLWAVGQRLQRQGLLSPAWLLTAVGQWHGVAGRIQAGEYQLDVGSTPQSLLQKLLRGEVVVYRVTFVEGWTLRQVLDLLQRQPKLEHRLAAADDAELARVLELDSAQPEGWIYPDTYHYRKGESDVQLLRRAHQSMKKRLAEQWSGRATDLPLKSPYEALILASIVEKETGQGSERPQIAGVFVRRLHSDMPLQTDPTLIYGLGACFDGNLTLADLRRPGPYNSYLNKGLPPTPIGLPGEAAIQAVLHPAAGDALYFVAKGDGSHHFSATLEAHQQAVEQYQQRQRRADYRSAPRNGGQ